MNNIEEIKPFEKKVWLASPTMHGEEQKYVQDAFDKNWITTAGENVNEVERIAREYVGVEEAVALSCGTAALHLAVKLAGERLYGQPKPGHGTLEGRKVLCSDMTFDATVNPVAYEGGEAVFIDTEADTWNMDPDALKRAFDFYPDVRLIVIAHLYGTPAKMDEIREIAKQRGALIVEDAAESFGAVYHSSRDGDLQTGTIGDYGVLSFNGNKIITGSSGGMLLTKDEYSANKARKWSTQSREDAPWYQHEEIGYNYRMSNVIAGVVRGQMLHLAEHLKRKREIYDLYREGFQNLPVDMNPYDDRNSRPNFWLSCLLIDPDAMCKEVYGERESLYLPETGKTCPTKMRETLLSMNVESRPIWKPMHMQPIYRNHPFVTKQGNGRAQSNAYITEKVTDVGEDLFRRGLCLPSDIKMKKNEQMKVIEIIRQLFK